MLVYRAIDVVGAGKIPRTHQKLIDDLAAGKPEGFLEQLNPLFLGLGMVRIEPVFEGAMFGLQLQDRFRIFNGGVHLEAVSDDARIAE